MPISIVAVSCSNKGRMSFFISKQARHILSNFKFVNLLALIVAAAILGCIIELRLSLLYNIDSLAQIYNTTSIEMTWIRLMIAP